MNKFECRQLNATPHQPAAFRTSLTADQRDVSDTSDEWMTGAKLYHLIQHEMLNERAAIKSQSFRPYFA
jgi:hypothetical protein